MKDKKIDKIDCFVIGVMTYWVLFVVAMTIIFCVKNMIPDTLVQYGLGGGAIELVCTAIIEIMNKRRDKNERDNLHSDSIGSDGNCGCGGEIPDSVAELQCEQTGIGRNHHLD